MTKKTIKFLKIKQDIVGYGPVVAMSYVEVAGIVAVTAKIQRRNWVIALIFSKHEWAIQHLTLILSNIAHGSIK